MGLPPKTLHTQGFCVLGGASTAFPGGSPRGVSGQIGTRLPHERGRRRRSGCKGLTTSERTLAQPRISILGPPSSIARADSQPGPSPVASVLAVWPEELPPMQWLAQTIWREAPKMIDMTMGELAYQGGMARSAPPTATQLRLWMSGGDCLGWGWFFPPDTLEYAVHPDSRSLLVEVFDWFDSLAPSDVAHRLAVREADTEALELVRARGFVADPDHVWMRLDFLDLD